jgi:DNA uptake protein ComE-like DNA-binding protein
MPSEPPHRAPQGRSKDNATAAGAPLAPIGNGVDHQMGGHHAPTTRDASQPANGYLGHLLAGVWGSNPQLGALDDDALQKHGKQSREPEMTSPTGDHAASHADGPVGGSPLLRTNRDGTATIVSEGVRWSVVGYRPSARGPHPGKAQSNPNREAGPKPGGRRINVNTATQAELEALPGVGPVIARRIIEGRPFQSVGHLERVRGSGRGGWKRSNCSSRWNDRLRCFSPVQFVGSMAGSSFAC